MPATRTRATPVKASPQYARAPAPARKPVQMGPVPSVRRRFAQRVDAVEQRVEQAVDCFQQFASSHGTLTVVMVASLLGGITQFILGILEIFGRSVFEPDSGWFFVAGAGLAVALVGWVVWSRHSTNSQSYDHVVDSKDRMVVLSYFTHVFMANLLLIAMLWAFQSTARDELTGEVVNRFPGSRVVNRWDLQLPSDASSNQYEANFRKLMQPTYKNIRDLTSAVITWRIIQAVYVSALVGTFVSMKHSILHHMHIRSRVEEAENSSSV